MLRQRTHVYLFCVTLFFSPVSHAALRAPSFPYISGDTFRYCSNFILDTISNFRPTDVVAQGSIIFVKTDFLKLFFETYHPAIQVPYILITHNSDISAPGQFNAYLDDPKLVHWFGINPTETHAKFTPIPIGIANQYVPQGNIGIFHQTLAYRHGKMAPRNKLLYSNFTASIPNVYHLDERCRVRSLFADKPWCTTVDEAQVKSPAEYLYDLLCYKFVLSPAGNGLDCLRHWESLLMGAIPIMKSSALDSLFEGLPVLIIDDWTQITEQFLELKYIEILNKTYCTEKMYIPWWLSLIVHTRNQVI